MLLLSRRVLFCAALLCLTLESRGGLIEVIANAKPSVVAVGTFNPIENPRFRFRGTAFAVGDGNLLVTSAHVLPEPSGDVGEARLVVLVTTGPTGERVSNIREASVVALDTGHDLALIRFAGSAIPTLVLAEADRVREGLSVAFIGFPIGGLLGFTPVTHRGVISAITEVALPFPNAQQLNARTLRKLRDGSFDIYQLDAISYPGNSGGPLLAVETGEVVGILNMGLVKSTKESALSQPTGISYAIPVRFIDDLMKRR